MQRLDKTFFGLVLASLLTMAAVLLSPARDMEHGIGLELLYALRGTRQPPQEVVIITLDSRSARALGQSERPERWPRHLHARLVNGLTDRGARVIGFDVLFERAREPDGDQALAAALHRAGNVVLMEGLSREAVTHPDGEIIAHVDHLTRPLPLLQDAAWASGPFIMPKTPEGVFEFWGFIPSIGDHPSLPMLMAQLMTAGTPAAISPSPDIRLHALNLYGPLGSIRTLSYVEALDRVADPVSGDAAFRGKAVLIGFSEFNQSRQGDIFRTPYSTPDGLDISGVELCATALSNLRDGSALLRPQGAPLLAALLAWSALLGGLWRFAGTSRALALSAGLSLAWIGLAGWSFAWQQVWLPVILPGLIAPVVATAFGLLSHGRAARQRQRDLEKALELGLSRKGSEKLVALLRGHEGGRSVHGVCLCSDIEAYTSLSETLSPAATTEALNRYFARFLPVIEANGGHVMDIVGDSAMCLWLADDTADNSAADACHQACAAALALHHLMNEAPAGDPTALPARFGLHYGPVFLGEVGADARRELRIVGDIVNTSSRIQGANKALGTRILASDAVLAQQPAAPDLSPAHARHLGRFVLAGKRSPIDLHDLTPTPLPADARQAFDTARQAYAEDALDLARLHLRIALAASPGDGPARFYVERCETRLAGEPLPDADGCVVLTHK